MSSTVVEYIVQLKDKLSGGIDNAKNHVNQLESSVSGAKTALGALGIAFGAFQIASFIKAGVEKYHELEQVTAKVEANLKSTGGAAGLGMEELGGFAKELSSKIQASRVEVIDMQSQLLTFPAITKDVFQQSMGLVADIAKQTGHGLSETAIMYGKALNSPVDGLQKMMRYGVMFTDAEKEKIGKLQASGNLIGAQKAMMESIAHSGYAGVAEAMFNADPIAKFNKMMGGAKTAVGEYATEILKKILPVLESFAAGIKNIVHWMDEHKKTSSLIIAVLSAVAVGFIAVAAGTSLWGAAIALVNLAMTASPLQLWVVGISALVAGVMWAWETFSGFRESVLGVWEVIKAFATTVGDILMGVGKVYKGIFTLDMGEVNQGLNQIVDAVGSAGGNMAKAWVKGSKEGADSFANDMYGADADKAASLTAKGIAGTKGAVGAGGADAVAAPKTKAEGQKTINIHVAYNAPLIQGFTISTTNMKEGFDELKTKVTSILAGATRDSLMVVDN